MNVPDNISNWAIKALFPKVLFLLYPQVQLGTFWYATSVGGAVGIWLILTVFGLIIGGFTVNGLNGGNPPLGFSIEITGGLLFTDNVLSEALKNVETSCSLSASSSFNLVVPEVYWSSFAFLSYSYLLKDLLLTYFPSSFLSFRPL